MMLTQPTFQTPQAKAGSTDKPFWENVFGNRRPDYFNFESKLAFVIMALKGERSQEVYSAIKDECARLGLNAARADESLGSGVIIKKITVLIQKAEFVICDLTHGRPNVYYELGYAHGVGNYEFNILLIAEQGTDLPFDIAPLHVDYYRSTEHLREIVATSL